MKTKNLVLLLFLLPLFTVAQRIEGGLLAGVNATQVAGDVASGYNKAGLTFGGFAAFNINQRSEFRMELTFSQKGSRVNPSETEPRQYLLRVNYIDIPFLYRYLYNTKLSFEGGLSYGYLISHYEEAEYSTDVSSTEFNTHALNIIIGLSYMLSPRFSANFRTVNSLIPIRPHASGVKRLFNSGQYNDVLTLSVNYYFGRNGD
ncbi:MAG: hypothetical protein A2X11_11110 [Bacteroidetes bacterium GWE2_42_24]|nr:MAG: hypothetical protein A2X11_11110 [Bacteroidetes bacterium GWE2_42_24]